MKYNLEKKTNTHGMRLAQPKSKFKPQEKQNPKSHQIISPCILNKIYTGKKHAPQNPKHIGEQEKSVNQYIISLNMGRVIYFEYLRIHTGMRQLDISRHNIYSFNIFFNYIFFDIFIDIFIYFFFDSFF